MRRYTRRKKKQIEISSLIDILFILLIFLMVSVRFTESNSRFEFDLPKSDLQVVGDSENELNISISKSGEHYLNGKEITKNDLYSFLRNGVRPELKQSIILEIDNDARFGDFFYITNLLKAQSISNVQIATKK